MSTPKNHHYVSQVHLKNFFNDIDGKIYVYDKIKKNHYSKTTTKSLFSEKFLNTRYIDGELDHVSLEEDLNINFENEFPKCYQTIIEFIKNRNLTPEVEYALYYFAKYGVIADFRTPRFKKNLDETLWDSFSQISQNATTELRSQIDKIFSYRKETKYINVLDYSNSADKILALMGGLIFRIQIPKNSDDYFLIPDVAAATAREKINKYFNPDIKEIAYICIPLSSKIFIHFHSEKLYEGVKPSSGIVYCGSDAIQILNKASLDYSQSKIACESKEYLDNFIRENPTFVQERV